MGFADHKDRYFHSVQYNMTRALNRLAELVEAEGGEVERHSDELLIHTTGYDEEIKTIKKQKENIEAELRRWEVWPGNELKKDVLHDLTETLQEIEKNKEDAPVVKTRFVSLISDLWIRFKLDGFAYELSFDSNPFFPDKWCKAPVSGGKGYYMNEIEGGDKFYYVNDMFSPVASDETIEYAAAMILSHLKKQKTCKRVERGKDYGYIHY